MISASPTHARALHAFVLQCLNLGDNGEALSPAPFDAAHVVWAERDQPQMLPLYAMIREVAWVARGPTEVATRSYPTDEMDPDDPDWYVELHRQICEWTVSIVVVHQQPEATMSHALQPGAILRRVYQRMWTRYTLPMRELGCAPTRMSDIRNLSSSNRVQWEPRASFDLTLTCGTVIADRPGRIESIEAVGTLTPPAPGASGTVTTSVSDDT